MKRRCHYWRMGSLRRAGQLLEGGLHSVEMVKERKKCLHIFFLRESSVASEGIGSSYPVLVLDAGAPSLRPARGDVLRNNDERDFQEGIHSMWPSNHQELFEL